MTSKYVALTKCCLLGQWMAGCIWRCSYRAWKIEFRTLKQVWELVWLRCAPLFKSMWRFGIIGMPPSHHLVHRIGYHLWKAKSLTSFQNPNKRRVWFLKRDKWWNQGESKQRIDHELKGSVAQVLAGENDRAICPITLEPGWSFGWNFVIWPGVISSENLATTR